MEAPVRRASRLFVFLFLVFIYAGPASAQWVSVSPGIVSEGQPVTLSGYPGSSYSGVTHYVWQPDGQQVYIGDEPGGSYQYTPSGGLGTYWYQFCVRDVWGECNDEWAMFTVVSGSGIAPAATASPTSVIEGSSVTLVRSGAATNGVAWTENVIWQPDGQPEVLGNMGLGAMNYVPHGGTGTYWYQFRLVDNNMNYEDQWISFNVIADPYGPVDIEGFGAGTTGGWQPGRDVYMVTSLADSGTGTLREACESNHDGHPRVIRFATSGTIYLQQPIQVPSNTTIDGRGQFVMLHGKGLKVVNNQNVIITHISIFGVAPNSEDGIQIIGSHHVVLNHLWLFQMTTAEGTSQRVDEAISIVLGSTDITIAWCWIKQWEKVILLGNGDPGTAEMDSNMRVTIHHNFFQATGRRHPEARYGQFDVYNNYLYDWQMLHHNGLAGNPAGDSFGVKCRDNCRMVLQNNVFARNEHFRNFGTHVQNASWCESGGVIEDRGGQWVPWGQYNVFNVGCPPISSAFTFPEGYIRNVEPVGGDVATRVAYQTGPRLHGLEY